MGEPHENPAPGTRPVTGTGMDMLKMKELVEATGVAKSTILLYVSKGLLPRPVKTSPNMAYYDPGCVDRTRFIKDIQCRHRLPLAAIKGLLRAMDKGRDIAPLLALQSTVFGAASEKMKLGAFLSASGLTRRQLASLCDAGLIMPVEPGLFDGLDLDLARQLKSLMDKGLDLADFSFYPQLARKIVAAEIQLREKYTRDLDFEENAAMTLEMTRTARGLRAYVIDRTLQKELIGFKGLHENNTP